MWNKKSFSQWFFGPKSFFNQNYFGFFLTSIFCPTYFFTNFSKHFFTTYSFFDQNCFQAVFDSLFLVCANSVYATSAILFPIQVTQYSGTGVGWEQWVPGANQPVPALSKQFPQHRDHIKGRNKKYRIFHTWLAPLICPQILWKYMCFLLIYRLQNMKISDNKLGLNSSSS